MTISEATTELEKLNANIEYARQNFEYRKLLYNLCGEFFRKKNSGETYEQAIKVFDVLPPPVNEAEQEAKDDIFKLLTY